MKGLSTKEIRKLEEKAKGLSLIERILIENASSNLANIVVKYLLRILEYQGRHSE